MQAPLFYHTEATVGDTFALDESSARHAVQVLRLTEGSALDLTNGEGTLWEATIVAVGKKGCSVQINSATLLPRPYPFKVSIAIAPIKNTGRLEWFIEKATELGIENIYLLQTHRTEKQHLRYDRLINISVSAMLQSRQVWQPRIVPPQPLSKLLPSLDGYVKMIAHCAKGSKHSIPDVLRTHPACHRLLFIGPEGDFTPEEVAEAQDAGCVPVHLGPTRLRTETAGVAGATLLCLHAPSEEQNTL